ncbi:hypothetical protein M2390_001090 [Mycetocola sp. BIGb0189]|uniref:hypothetical protein n=1 Tax=Mycetocola sp. BIGb0189 TaxID=2940604 RepID=UPI0021691A9C|nr:hypothetical protein [Mycetocola sp. BIGb0189]MCS4275918.1 hypothetical protein [Mycetocola sp. BIGb0189]
MRKRGVAGIAVVACVLTLILAALITDLRDRSLPEAVGARASVVLTYPSGATDDARLRSDLAAASARFGLGLVRALPAAVSGGGSVYAELERERDRPKSVPRFGPLPAASLVGADRLESSPTAGEYLVTGTTADRAGFARWARSVAIDMSWRQDSPGETIRLVLSQPSFLMATLAVFGLSIVSMLGWLTVRARGRALSILAGIRPSRVLLADIRLFSGTFLGTSTALTAVTALIVGLWRGWVFVPRIATLLAGGILTGWILAVLVGVSVTAASLPTSRMLARRIPPMRALGRVGAIARVILLAAVLGTLSPALSAQAQASDAARQLSQWESLGQRTEIVIPSGTEERWQRLRTPVAAMLRAADERGLAALSIVWEREQLREYGVTGNIPAAIMFATPRWFPEDRVPAGTRNRASQSLRESFRQDLENWTGTSEQARSVSESLELLTPVPGTDVLGVGLGNGTLDARPGVGIVMFENLNVFNNDFLAALATSGNIVLRDRESAQQLLAEFGLQGEVRARYIAENGLVQAQFAAGFATLSAAALAALILGLVLATILGARIHAEVNARADHPLRVAGVRPLRVVAARVRTESIQAAAVVVTITAIVGIAQQPGFWIVAGVGVLAILLTPLTHMRAGQRVFVNLRHRRI